jgi:hypothetical protein
MDGIRSMRSPASASSAAYHVQLLSTVNEGSHSGLNDKTRPSPAALSFTDAPRSVKSDAFGSTSLVDRHERRYDDEASFA